MTEKRALAKSKSIARARQEGAEANTPCYALAPRQIVYTNCLATPERKCSKRTLSWTTYRFGIAWPLGRHFPITI
jgi:hypothetical protein